MTKAKKVTSLLVSCALMAGLGGCAQPKPPPAPPQPRYFSHVVRYQGETLGRIAAWYTGSEKNWKIIADHNRGLKINRMRPGDIIEIPYPMLTKHTAMPKSAVASAKAAPAAKEEAVAPVPEVSGIAETQAPSAEDQTASLGESTTDQGTLMDQSTQSAEAPAAPDSPPSEIPAELPVIPDPAQAEAVQAEAANQAEEAAAGAQEEAAAAVKKAEDAAAQADNTAKKSDQELVGESDRIKKREQLLQELLDQE